MDQNDMLNALLNDPEKLQSAIAMASSLFSGASNSTPPSFPSPPPAPPPPPVPDYDPSAELIAKALPMITQVMQTSQQAITPEKKALLQAMKPFLSDTAGQQIDHGMRLVMLAHIASSIMGQFGRRDNENV